MTDSAMKYPTSDICDALRGLRGRDQALRQVPLGSWMNSADEPIFGPAWTLRISRALEPVETAVADWMAAFDEAPPDAVMVVEVVGDVGGGVVGDAAVTRLVHRGCAGMIVDGPIRDWRGISGAAIPSWVRGTRPDGTNPPMNLNECGVDIRCGGVPVTPGDIVAADQDGVIVIPAAEWEAVQAAVDKITNAEARMFELLAEGKSIGEAYKATSRA
jgi:4-hydroxy-4-methyl-2-oxoglutarate aldolase